jgi:hypothetical protein
MSTPEHIDADAAGARASRGGASPRARASSRRGGWVAAVVGVAALGIGTTRVGAHGGQPAIARLETPDRPGIVADGPFTLRWTDADRPTAFGPGRVSLFFSDRQRPTFFPGEIPPDVPGAPIVRGILEPDLANTYLWDTSTVATGAYFVWSLVDEPPEEPDSIRVISYAPHLLHVVRDGDPAPVSVMITMPDNAYRIADERFVIRYAAFDPTGSARVRLEASPRLDGEGFVILAEDLPALPDGRFEWDTRALPDGTWTLRATIGDGCGRSFTAYARFFVRVTHPASPIDGGTPLDAKASAPLDARVDDAAACGPWSRADLGVDAGSADGPEARADAGPDAGPAAARDAADGAPGPEGGCACGAAGTGARGGAPEGVALAAGLLLALAVRLRRSAKPATTVRMHAGRSTENPRAARGHVVVAGLAALVLSSASHAQPVAGTKTASAARAPGVREGLRAEAGQVLTYYGLRKLELDATVADDEKAREWEAFIDRATEQVAYARSAVLRWREAGRIRLVEAAELAERSPDQLPRDREAAWKKVIELYPRSADAKTAAKKVAFHRGEETRRLVGAAQAIEAGRTNKLDRVRAWAEVVTWIGARDGEGKKAQKRVGALQEQLFKEAQDLDRIKRVDAETRLQAWLDVLASGALGTPRRIAEERVRALEAELGRGPGRGGAGR